MKRVTKASSAPKDMEMIALLLSAMALVGKLADVLDDLENYFAYYGTPDGCSAKEFSAVLQLAAMYPPQVSPIPLPALMLALRDAQKKLELAFERRLKEVSHEQ